MENFISLTDGTGKVFNIAIDAIGFIYDDDGTEDDKGSKILFRGMEGGVRCKESRVEILNLIQKSKESNPYHKVLVEILREIRDYSNTTR